MVQFLSFDFPFLAISLFSCVISRFKRQKNCFSSHSCFLLTVVLLVPVLSLLFLLAGVSLLPRFSTSSLSPFIDASTTFPILASSLPPFYGIFNPLTPSLGCNTFCIDITFLVLWFISLSSSLVLHKTGPEYLMKGTTPVFIPLIRFLLPSFVLCSFLLNYSFLISFLSPLDWWHQLPRC